MKNNKKVQGNQTAGKQNKSAVENDDREEVRSKKGDSDLDSENTREKKEKATKNGILLKYEKSNESAEVK